MWGDVDRKYKAAICNYENSPWQRLARRLSVRSVTKILSAMDVVIRKSPGTCPVI